jgi:hypothetical protein
MGAQRANVEALAAEPGAVIAVDRRYSHQPGGGCSCITDPGPALLPLPPAAWVGTTSCLEAKKWRA